jgi:hypothetical protein
VKAGLFSGALEMPKLIAIKEHHYDHKPRMPGDVYEAGDRDAELLKRAKKAKDAPADEAKPAKAAAKPETEASSSPHGKAPAYRRRDMKAET